MSLEAGEFAIQSGTGGGREAESPPTNLEGLPRTLAPSLDLSSPSPACLAATKFLPLALDLDISSSFSPPPPSPSALCPLLAPCALPLSLSLSCPPSRSRSLTLSHSLSVCLSLPSSLLPAPASRCDSRFYVYKTRRARFDGKTTARVGARSRSPFTRIWYYCA